MHILEIAKDIKYKDMYIDFKVNEFIQTDMTSYIDIYIYRSVFLENIKPIIFNIFQINGSETSNADKLIDKPNR